MCYLRFQKGILSSNKTVKRLKRVTKAKSHLTISNKWNGIVQCYGLTQNPSNGDYMLVMNKFDIDLRKYLQQNHNQLTWKERIQIITDITGALVGIHYENATHRDLHSGNILFSANANKFFISDLRFCRLADKPLKSIYGNLPYIAPEIIIGKEQTFKSDIYSIAMLMWEVSSGQPPFNKYEDDYDLAMNIVNGIRPKIVPGTPLEYKNLMKQCWDADPSKRPDIITLDDKIREINFFYQNKSNELLTQPEEKNNNFEIENYTNSSKLFTAFDDFNKSSSEKNSISKISTIFKDDYKIESMQKQIKKLYINDNDEDEAHNNPNLHSEEQELPESLVKIQNPPTLILEKIVETYLLKK
ncbi:kinase-like domain-containing protein [Rhizophagus diaphanus]|nr:kinase-like domain-containing protein [Rhizophagus diaphanus] [Rhizophagus sp. MUCL 43196]